MNINKATSADNSSPDDHDAFDTGGPQPSLPREFWEFLRCNKKWWLIPILLTLFVLGLFVAITSTPLGPFVYTLF